MTESTAPPSPLEIERVHASRPSAGETRLILSGRWRGPAQDAAEPPLLVIQIEGHRHRFPAESGAGAAGPGESWRATFAVPDWAQPRHEGQAAVWIGNAIVAVPPLHGDHRAPPVPVRPAAPEPEAQLEGQTDEAEADSGVEAAPRGATIYAVPDRPAVASATDAPRSGPLADLLLKETVSALHAELEHRTADAARLRGALGDARSELEARSATQTELESTLGELGVELRRLMAAVEEQRSELEALRAHEAGQREEAERRLAELTAEQERQRSELTAAHDRRLGEMAAEHEQRLSDAGQAHEQRIAELTLTAEDQNARAQQRGAEAGALREELASAHVARDAALAEAAALQNELSRVGAELAVTRERVTSESGDLGEATRLLADAKALADSLRGQRDSVA